MRMTYLLTGDRARWEVMWVVRRNGKTRIVCHEFENDFSGATELYLRVKATSRKMVTLRCCNTGFPPPERLRPHWKEEKKVVGHKTVKRDGKPKRIKIVRKEQIEIIPLQELNLKGIWWCPYCRELRRFALWDGVSTDGSFFKLIETKRPMFIWDPGYHCPMCGISHRDSHVRRWNPQAQVMEYRTTRRRSNGRKRTTPKRTRRGT